jgi:hypothetical protein
MVSRVPQLEESHKAADGTGPAHIQAGSGTAPAFGPDP